MKVNVPAFSSATQLKTFMHCSAISLLKLLQILALGLYINKRKMLLIVNLHNRLYLKQLKFV